MDNAIGDSEKYPAIKMKTDLGLRRRLIVIIILLPLIVFFSILGGWPFTIFITAVLCLAAYEFWNLFRTGGYSPSLPVMVFFVAAAAILRYLFDFEYSALWLVLLIFTSMLWQVIAQQNGSKTAAVDFVSTVGGAVYLGFLGSYAISLRTMDTGLFWLLLALPVISIADSGAYLIGRVFGDHKMIPMVSPKKSWEGYIAGIVFGTLGGWGLAALWHIRAASILPIYGVILGAIISILAPIGDFGESMLKRQFNVKDSSKALLDHGGFLDRIDSSLWAVAIGYHLIVLLLG